MPNLYAPPDEAWRKEHFKDCEPLRNIPSIGPPKKDFHGVRTVVAGNIGRTTLIYSATGTRHIAGFRESFIDGQWRVGGWDWCGTGKKQVELAPGQEVILEFRLLEEDDRRDRKLAAFGEKGTNRVGLVVLGEEPKQ